MEDLGGSDILVLDGDALGACGVGIESTVAKIDVANERILILRMGGVTQTRLREALKEGGEEFARISVHAGSVAGGKAEAATGPGDGEEALSEREPAGNAGQAPGVTSLRPLCVVLLLHCGHACRRRMYGIFLVLWSCWCRRSMWKIQV